jgi:hypothetical protein
MSEQDIIDWLKAQRDKRKSSTREAQIERFKNVIRIAGYGEQAVESICAEWIDRVTDNTEEFDKMCKEYEERRHE